MKNRMDKTYFYDSDLYGGSYQNISNCLSISANQENLAKFIAFWENEIKKINTKEEEIDCFLNLLVDLSVKVREEKKFDIKVVVSNADYFDLMSLISTLLKTFGIKVDVNTAADLFNLWKNSKMTKLIDAASNMKEIQSLIIAFLKNIKEKEKFDYDESKYEELDFSYYKSSLNFNISRCVENRLPLYVEVFKHLNAELVVPNTIKEEDFYKLYHILANNNKVKDIVFKESSQNDSMIHILEFVSSRINRYMYDFVTDSLENISSNQKNIIILIWGLWLSTAQNISLIPITWYEKYRKMLSVFLRK